MSDPMVLAAQEWVNATYNGLPGYTPCTEDGNTGQATVNCLIMGLQAELGISPLVPNLGPTTWADLQAYGSVNGSGDSVNMITLVQCALYCKGFDGSALSGAWDARTQEAVKSVQVDVGYSTAAATSAVSPKLFRELLSTDAIVLVVGGSPTIRSVQQWLNVKYIDRENFFYIPCDGYFSREVNTALIYAIQYEIGLSDSAATGNFGPATQAGLKTAQAHVSVGSVDSASSFVHLFQAALTFNGWTTAFTGTYSTGTASTATQFQGFAALPSASIDGTANFQTWASLLISTGDATRPTIAFDASTEITAARAAALVAAGYTIAGRYLINGGPEDPLNKNIKPGELATITGAGMRVVPIFETGYQLDWFTSSQGAIDAWQAYQAALGFGFKRGSIIYFAVDADVEDTDIVGGVIPYFRSISSRFVAYGNYYTVGIYGPRNACSQVLAAGYAESTWAGDLSTGWSGNLGFPLPASWAFDQIATVDVGSGTGAIQVDNDVASTRYLGESSFDTPAPTELLDVNFNFVYESALEGDFHDYVATVPAVPGVPFPLTPDTNPPYPWTSIPSVQILLANDDLITELSRAYRMRKSLIQTPLLWETRRLTDVDYVADGLVIEAYEYMEAAEAWEADPVGPPPAPPVPFDTDSSTGMGQIFASTAIAANNYAVSEAIISGLPLDGSDWHTVWSVWQQLRGDPTYTDMGSQDFNISMIPLVLIHAAQQAGVTGDRLDYSDEDITKILIQYNGSSDYGPTVKPVYDMLETYNAYSRGEI